MFENKPKATKPDGIFPQEHPKKTEIRQRREQLEKRIQLEILLDQMSSLEKYKVIDSSKFNSFMVTELGYQEEPYIRIPVGDFNKIFTYLHKPQYNYGLSKPLSFTLKFKYLINETKLGEKYRMILLDGLDKFVGKEKLRIEFEKSKIKDQQKQNSIKQVRMNLDHEDIERGLPTPKPYQEELSQYLTKVPRKPKRKILYGQENLFDNNLNEFFRSHDDLIDEYGAWLQWRDLDESSYPDPETRVEPTLEHFRVFVIKNNSDVFNSSNFTKMMRILSEYSKKNQSFDFMKSIRIVLGKLPNNTLRKQLIRELEDYVTYMAPQRTKYFKGEIIEPWAHQNDPESEQNNVGDNETLISDFDDPEKIEIEGDWSDGDTLNLETNQVNLSEKDTLVFDTEGEHPNPHIEAQARNNINQTLPGTRYLENLRKRREDNTRKPDDKEENVDDFLTV